MSVPRLDGLPRSAYATRKKDGRPMICVTLDRVTLKLLDTYCRKHGLSRGDAIAMLLA